MRKLPPRYQSFYFDFTDECPACAAENTREYSSDDFDYQPREKMIINPPEDAYPGCPESATFEGDTAALCKTCRRAYQVDAGDLEREFLEQLHQCV